MAMSNTAHEVIAQAEILEAAAAKLREAAALLTNGQTTRAPRRSRMARGPRKQRKLRLGRPPKNSGTRLDQLNDWLLSREPEGATRKECLEESGVPENTVKASLTKNNFDRDDDGKWHGRKKK